MQFSEAFKGPVIGPFNVRGKSAGRQFTGLQMIGDTVAADAFARTGIIGAGAAFFVLLLFAFHEDTSETNFK